MLLHQDILFAKFLSTPSARRATKCCRTSGRGGRISIHALREEGDEPPRYQLWLSCEFLSTPSARRATHFLQL